MTEHDAAGAAREEAARQGVWIVAMLVAIPLLAWAERKATHPDTAREWKMRAARAGERAAAHAAAHAWRAAEWCRKSYESQVA